MFKRMMEKKKNFRFYFGIRQKLILSYVIVIVIPVLIGAYLPYFYTHKIIVSETDSSLRFSIEKIVDLIKHKMTKYHGISNKLTINSSLRKYISVDYTDKEGEALEAAREINERFADEISNSNGEIVSIKLYKNNSMPNYADYLLDEKDFKDTEWYKGVHENRGVIYWKAGIYQEFNRPPVRTVSLINRINNSIETGLIEIELRQDKIFNDVESFSYKKGSMICVIDEQQRFITGNPDSQDKFYEILPFIRQEIANTGIESFTKEIGKDNYIIINKELNFQGWSVIAAVSIKELYASTKTIRLVTIVTAISCILVFMCITVFISTLFTSRLKKLAYVMRNVEQGDFNVELSVKGNDEISQLGKGFNSMVKSIRNLIEEVYKSKLEKKEAELRALQEQIEPHFLYNSLSSINWLAVEAGAPKILDAVEALATFYRLSLNKGKEIISLKDEMAQAKAYVSLQKLRYENSFDVFFDMDSTVEDAQIIKFIVQPFLENAIIHGFGDDGRGSIYVTAGMDKGKNILIRIIDNGKGIARGKMEEILSKDNGGNSTGYGIKNVNERIRLHYGEKYGVSISSEQGTGTVVEIKLPFIKHYKKIK